MLQPVLGGGLFLAEGDAWRHQRRTIAPALVPRTMPILSQHVVGASAAKEEELAALTHRPVELLPHLQHLALAIAGQSMFSLEMSGFAAELRGLLLSYGMRYAQPGILDMLLPESVPSITDRGRAAFRTEWLAFLDRLIAVRAGYEPATDRARDLFDLLATARDPETGAGFDHAQLRDEVSTMILANHETTAVTLFWSVYLAALYPEQQERLAQEVSALRLNPPAFLIVGQAQAADSIMGHDVAAGTTITISPWVLHRHRARWHAPDAFDPDRFAPGAPPPAR